MASHAASPALYFASRVYCEPHGMERRPHTLGTSVLADCLSIASTSTSSGQDSHQEETPTGAPPTPYSASSHALSLSASSAGSRKGRHAEPGTTEVNATAFAAVPHSPTSVKSAKGLAPPGYDALDTCDEESVLEDHPSAGDADGGTPRTESNSHSAALPEPALSARRSLSNIHKRRSSSGSVFSLASARGILHSSTPPNGADSGASTRSVPSFASKSSGPALSESHPTTIAMQGGNQTAAPPAQNVAGQGHQARENLVQQNLDLMRRNQSARSRSRVQRRFSGSTAHSSHSPSSERGAQYRDKEEGEWIAPAPSSASSDNAC